MNNQLKKWIVNNNLDVVETIQDFIYEIKDFGKFILVKSKIYSEGEAEIILEYIEEFSTDLILSVSQDELNLAKENDCKYFLFKFGGKFYYSPIVRKEIEECDDDGNNYAVYPIKLNYFKYIGTHKQFEISNNIFPYLGIHTEYELLNGSRFAKDWVTKAKFLDFKVLGICDKNTLAGTISFQMECNAVGIKSILGSTISIKYSDFLDLGVLEAKVYALSEKGWRNLLNINKKINVDNEGFIYDYELLSYGEGVALVFTRNSILNKLANRNKAYKIGLKHVEKFEKVYYQIDSVQFSSPEYDLLYLNYLKEYFELEDWFETFPPILINDSYYLDKEEHEIKNLLNNIEKTVNKEPESQDQYFKTLQDCIYKLKPLFRSNLDLFNKIFYTALNNLKELSDSANFKISLGNHKLPKFVYKGCTDKYKNLSNEDLFYLLLKEGIDDKLKNIEDEYLNRLKIECSVILNANFLDYFLILWDIIRYAKKEADNKINGGKGFLVGVGRGSVGGSLVAYLLDIIDIDPIKYDLMFERFLNEARVSGEKAKAADSLPDIDVDFETEHKDLIKRYIEQQYGVEQTCSIGTYTRLKLKGSIKDFMKVRGLSFQERNEYTSNINEQLVYTWDDLFKFAIASENKNFINFIKRYVKTFNLMKTTLNQARSSSVHASAVIITPEYDDKGNRMTVFDWMPVKKIKGALVSEWEGKYTDKAGFLKEDILGLTQLDKFRDILYWIKKNEKIDFDNFKFLTSIPIDDKKTYDLFCKGYNEDVFQFNSLTFKRYFTRLKPKKLEELIAANALIRPGTMRSNAHEDFIDIKTGRKEPIYDYGLKEVTENTFGLYVYQEQIMKAVNVLGGFPLSKADEVRTVMKKLDKVKMASLMEDFIKGAEERGCPTKQAEKIWFKLEKFSNYGFNRSHSAAYGLMGYWSQWLKANYPLEFWTVCFDNCDEKIDMPYALDEFYKVFSKNINILPPNINKSDVKFTCEKINEGGNIYWSLAKIKGVGEASVVDILDNRKKIEEFYNLEHYLSNVGINGKRKNIVTCLISVGCFDELYNFGVNINRRKELLEEFFWLKKQPLPDELNAMESNENSYWVMQQRKLTGFGFINMKYYLDKLSDKNFVKSCVQPNKFFEAYANVSMAIVGELHYLNIKKSKKGFYYVSGQLFSNNKIMNFMVWQEKYEEYKNLFDDLLINYKKKTIILGISGYVRKRDYQKESENVLQTNRETKIYILN